jgi:hypothetical protein
MKPLWEEEEDFVELKADPKPKSAPIVYHGNGILTVDGVGIEDVVSKQQYFRGPGYSTLQLTVTIKKEG